jgi:hypothetical protein
VPSSIRLLYVEMTLLCDKKIVKKSTSLNREPLLFVQNPDLFFLPLEIFDTDTFPSLYKTMVDIVYFALSKAKTEEQTIKANYSKIEKMFDSLLFFGTRPPKLGKKSKDFSVFVSTWTSLIQKFPLDLIDEHHFGLALEKFVPFEEALFPKMFAFALYRSRFDLIQKAENDEDYTDLVSEEDSEASNTESKKRKRAEVVDLLDTFSEDERERTVKHVRTAKDRAFVKDDFTDDESFDEEDEDEDEDEDDDDDLSEKSRDAEDIDTDEEVLIRKKK